MSSPNKRRSVICTTVLTMALLESVSACARGDDLPLPDPKSLLDQALAVREKLGPSIVKFSYGDSDKLHFGCGVIISDDGIVAVSGPVQAVLSDELLDLELAGGRHVRGKALGWTTEFGFGLLKITDGAHWPFAKLRDDPKVKAGDFCVALGFRRDGQTESKPIYRVGVVTQTATSYWLTTSCGLNEGAHPIFDLDGSLIGLNCRDQVGGDSIFVGAGRIKTYLPELIAGKNLDRVRLQMQEQKQSVPPAVNQSKSESKSETSLRQIAMKAAEQAAVRMYVPGNDRVLVSGVIVTPDGYVITCGHHEKLPGQELRVLLTDDREATGVVLGTNLLADVGVVKLKHGENWPCVPLGYSSDTGPGDECTVIGFPNSHAGPKPWTLDTKIIRPTHTLPKRDEWGCEFWTMGTPYGLGGASGSGVFNAQGHLIGILLGGASDQMQNNRVELFHREWSDLTAGTPFDTVNAEWLKNVRLICDHIK